MYRYFHAFLSPYVKKFYGREFPEQNTKKYIKRVKEEFRQMVLRTPGLPGNSLEINLYFAAYIFALNKADPDCMGKEAIDRLVDEVFHSKLIVTLHKNKKCTMFTEKEMKARMDDMDRSGRSDSECRWAGYVIPGKDEFHMTYTECGICKMAAKEGMSELVPSLCRMDYPNYSNDGGILFRTKTLGYGDDECNFHVVRKNSEALKEARKRGEDQQNLK